MGWLSGWKKRFKVSVDNTLIDAVLTNWVAKLHGSTSAGIGGVDVSKIFDELTSNANRKKIAITSSDGTTQLYAVIERWDDASEAFIINVKIPSVASGADTVLYFYFDVSQPDNTTYIGDAWGTEAEPPNNKNVWTSRDVIWLVAEEVTNHNLQFVNDVDFSDEIGLAFTGSGLNDLSVPALGGYYSGDALTQDYRVEIDGTGTPDTFRYSDDGGGTWVASGIAITGASQTLNNSVKITFNATTGHTNGDRWDFDAIYVSMNFSSVGAGQGLQDAWSLAFAGLTFNGADAAPHNAPGDVFTIRGVINTSFTGRIIGRNGTAGAGTAVDWQISITGGGYLDFGRADGGGAREGFADNTTTINSGTFRTFAFVNHANNNHRLFVDGVLVFTDTTVWTQTPAGTRGSIYMATDGTTALFLSKGSDIEIVATNVSDADIKAWHNSLWDTLVTWSDFEIGAEITSGVGMGATFLDWPALEVLLGAVGMDSELIGGFEILKSLTEGVGMSDTFEPMMEYMVALDSDIKLTDEWESVNWTKWLEQFEKFAVNRYYLTLTGAPDGTTDVQLPMKSFQIRARTDGAGNSTISLIVYIPSLTYAAQITARPNGELVCEMTYEIDGGIEYTSELARVPLEDVKIFEGGTNKSTSLAGSRTWAAGTQKLNLTRATYSSTDDGSQRFRFALPDFFLKAGDTVTVDGGVEFEVVEIVYSVAVRNQQMEISED